MLGLIAERDILIASTLPALGDREVHGVLMALGNNLEVEDYQQGPPRGAFIVYGGLIVEKSIHIGQFQHESLVSGYLRDYRWDERLSTSAPPFFPKTGNYLVIIWEEITPPEA